MSSQSLPSILFITCLIVSLSTTCIAQSFQWAKQMGSTGWDEGTAIVTDTDNNVYVTGLFRGTVDFDPGPGVLNLTAVDEKDAFICKLDADGELLWVKQYGDSASIDEKSSLTIDAAGNLYLTNSFMGKADFDPGPGSFPLMSQGWDRDIFIQKLDADGHFIWAKQISAQPSFSPAPTHANAITLDESGHLYLTGYFDGTVDFDPDSNATFTMTALTTNSFVCKLDIDGNFIWAREFESAIPGIGAVGYAIAVDANGNVYSTGTIGGTVDFDPGPGVFNVATTAPPYLPENYLSKLDADGHFAWAKALGPGQGNTVVVDENKHVIAGGWSSMGYTPSLHKFDSAGNTIWAIPLEGSSGIQSITLDQDGDIYAFGRCCTDTVDFDPGPAVYPLTGSNSNFIGRYDPMGNFISVDLLDATVHATTRDQDMHVYVTGYFFGTTDFDPSASNFDLTATHYNVFVLKLKSVPTVGLSENVLQTQIKLYPNPTSGKVLIEFEQAQPRLHLVVRNMLGQAVSSQMLENVHQAELWIDGSTGVYLLDIFDDTGQKAVYQIVKE